MMSDGGGYEFGYESSDSYVDSKRFTFLYNAHEKTAMSFGTNCGFLKYDRFRKSSISAVISPLFRGESIGVQSRDAEPGKIADSGSASAADQCSQQ